MKIRDIIKNNSLLIIPSGIKSNIISEVTKLDGFYNIKYVSFEEIENRLYSYDKDAILYLMDKYHYKYNVACVLLNNIRYVEDKFYNNKKIDNLVKIRSELLELGFIKYRDIENYQYENIIVYGYTYISKYRKKILNSLEDKYNIYYIEDEDFGKDNKIYEFNSIKDEIVFVCESICDLINKKIAISNIKLVIEDSSYEKLVNNIFSLYGLKTNIKNKTSLDVSTIGRYFLDNLDKDIEDILDKIKDDFDMNNSNNTLVYNKIINLLNKYKNLDNINKIIEYDFKHSYLDSIRYDNEIEVVSIYDNVFNDDDFVFILGFNQNQIPRINKDEGFFNNSELELLQLDTTIDKNKYEKAGIIRTIKSINNLVISYKLVDNNGSYLLTTLNDNLGYEVIRDNKKKLIYSNSYNKIKLGMLIDNLVKYGVYSDDLDKLYNSYLDINYLDYDNTYKQIDKNDLLEYLDNKILLSYSSLSNYFECSFKYYLTNILKIVPYEKTYKSLIGDVFHYILSICFDNEIDIDKEYDLYLEKVDFEIGFKERYFFDKLKDDLKFVIDSIKEQYKHTTFKDAYYEDKIIISKEINDVEITFMGIIDKLMYKKINDRELIAIVDYKTGNPEININNAIYGLDMQLPIYLYLAKNSSNFNNPIIVGFYLQKLLNSLVVKDYKNDYLDLKRDNLKLAGYSIDNSDLLSEFDDSFNKSSVIKSMSTTKNGSFNHYSKVVSEDNIDKLISIIEDNINKATNKIINANFDINPKILGKENKGCAFCIFSDICYVNPKNYVRLKEVDDIYKEVL